MNGAPILSLRLSNVSLTGVDSALREYDEHKGFRRRYFPLFLGGGDHESIQEAKRVIANIRTTIQNEGMNSNLNFDQCAQLLHCFLDHPPAPGHLSERVFNRIAKLLIGEDKKDAFMEIVGVFHRNSLLDGRKLGLLRQIITRSVAGQGCERNFRVLDLISAAATSQKKELWEAINTLVFQGVAISEAEYRKIQNAGELNQKITTLKGILRAHLGNPQSPPGTGGSPLTEIAAYSRPFSEMRAKANGERTGSAAVPR